MLEPQRVWPEAADRGRQLDDRAVDVSGGWFSFLVLKSDTFCEGKTERAISDRCIVFSRI